MEGAAEAAVATLDTVVLLTDRYALPAHAGNGHSPFMDPNVQILPADSGHFGCEEVLLGRFEDVHGGRPSGRPGRVAVESLLNGEQVADGIPAGKGHVKILPPCPHA